MGIPADIILDPAVRPDAIEQRSFAIIDSEIGSPPFAAEEWIVARRCIHTLGDTDIVNDLCFSSAAVEQGKAALQRGCTIFTDTRMAAAGLPARRFEPLGVSVQAMMALPQLEEHAAQAGCTRARAAIELLLERMKQQIVVIGNAPTALLALLEALEKQRVAPEDAPALIVGMPVGFVNAAQSKEWLRRTSWNFITLLGRKGGSAVAAATVNALATLLAERN